MKPTKAGSAAASQVLLGSSTLPSLIQIGDAEVQLGVVVASAHKESGMSGKDWNALDEAKRDELLNAHVEALRAQAAEQAEAARIEREASQSGQGDVRAAPLYPRQITIRNNGPMALAEPVCGAHVHAGGWVHATLHDADHQQRVLANFDELLARNGIPREALVIEGLPE